MFDIDTETFLISSKHWDICDIWKQFKQILGVFLNHGYRCGHCGLPTQGQAIITLAIVKTLLNFQAAHRWILSLQQNNNLCTLGLTMGTRDNFLVIGPNPPPPLAHFCGFVSHFGCLLVVFRLHRTCARKLVWSLF